MLVFFILPGKRVHVFAQGVHATPSSLRLCLYSYLAIHGEVIGNLQYRKLRAESERQVDVRWNKGNPCSQECVSKRGTVLRLSHFILITNYEEYISHADFQSKEWRLCKVRKSAQFTCWEEAEQEPSPTSGCLQPKEAALCCTVFAHPLLI